MLVKELEFRGIRKEHLGMYFEELGAEKVTDCFPYTYSAEGWTGQILSEEIISITSTFKVNAVFVRFSAESASALEELIKKYRYKTSRVGG